MAAAGRRSLPDLTGELVARPGEFDFVQAVRVAEDAAAAIARPVGSDEPPSAEAVRLKVSASLAFAPAPVRSAREAAPGRLELALEFLGLIGPAGALPQHYTELAIRRLQVKDPTFAAFLDLLQHRAASLFYRACRKHDLALSHEHAWRWGLPDPFERALAALVGRGTPALSDLESTSDRAWIFFAGHFARRSRSVQGLETLLAGYLGLPVRVRPFVGRWIEIPEAHRSALPCRSEPAGRNCTLGADCVLGGRVWDVRSAVRIEIGPLETERFLELRPDGRQMSQLRRVIDDYLDRKTEFQLALLVASGETLPVRLSAPGPRESRLGWTSWLTARDPARAKRLVRFSFARS